MFEVLLVDDEALVRDAISTNMKWEELGYHLAGTCKNGKEAMEFLAIHKVELVITDICMPFVDGLELARYIYEKHTDTRTIILSGYNEFEYAKTAVKYQVVEYVLKPVTVAELNEILLRVKETISEERKKKESLHKLTDSYQKNLPILRSRYLNQLVKGMHKQQPEEKLHEKLRELHRDISGECYMIALMVAEHTEDFLNSMPEAAGDLPEFILFNILEEMTSADDKLLVFQDLQNNTTLLMSGISEVFLLEKLQKVYDDSKGMMKEYFGLGVTLGIGSPVNLLYKVHKSYEGAVNALEYRFLYGQDRVLFIKDFVEMDQVRNIEISDDIRKLTLAVKLNSKAEIAESLKEIVSRLRKLVLSSARIYICVQNILVALNNLVDSLNLTDEEITERQNNLLRLLYTMKTLEEVEKLLCEYCYYIGEILAEQRDSFSKKQAIIAVEYIEEHYMDEDLTLQSMCSDLAISMSYFSTIFKRYTGETFIEALTKRRMKAARELLSNTTLKVYEIAEKAGYADPHYFAITFKKITGLTPKEYARKEGRLHV